MKRTKSASKISKPDIDVNVNSDRGFKDGGYRLSGRFVTIPIGY